MQRENELIYAPMRSMLLDRGWLVTKTHGNEFQKGLPDLRISHPKFGGGKWVELKVIDFTPKGTPQVKLTRAQKDLWPKWIAHGEKIWVVAAPDLRGLRNKKLREQWYNRICYKEHNVQFFLHPSTVKYGIEP